MKKNSSYDILEAPIKGEIFSPERLEQYALYLADHLEISELPGVHRELLSRVEDNCETLIEIYQKLITRLQNGKSIPFAGAWLVDNFFVIEDQIREIRQDLPKKYYDELPKIKNGELAGYPRIYSMALTLIAHLDSHLEFDTIKQFTRSFQAVSPLMSGEIWAIPITLRIALIENLRRLMVQIIHIEELKESADLYADKILTTEFLSNQMKQDLQDLLCKSHISDCVSIAQISKRLRDYSPGVLPIYDLMTKYLTSKNLTIEEIVHADHLLQAITQVSVGNIVTTMRLLSSCDWQEFFESVSLLDPILASDPLGVYKKMDFSTRDRYRHVVENLSKKSKVDELDVARQVVKLAQHAASIEPHRESKLHQQHVGYFLIDNGLLILEEILSYKLGIREKIQRFLLRHPNLFYMGTLTILMLFFWVLMLTVYNQMVIHTGIYFLLMALALLPLSDTALNLLNLFVTLMIPPRILPKYELEKIPDEAKTFIVIPTIFNNKAAIQKLIENLEIHYLSNQDDNLFFAILSDFSDAHQQNMPEDFELLTFAEQRLKELNQRYLKEQAATPQFFLFHRPRLWNSSEQKWMGWERKRGKLEQFNLYLRGKIDSPFIQTTDTPLASLNFYSQIKYVITLDSDTLMPRDSAKKLIGIILHPSNAPQFEEGSSRLHRGYCILQPRISIKTTSSAKSFFSSLYCGHTGIDPYTTAVSDVYQDLFAEGSFVGKGLYVVDAFIRCLENKIEENTILSHDLIEGVIARTALVSDVEFLDDYPSHYDAYAKRLHRWIRGDWQIFRWIFSKGPEGLSFISRWKIFDNLRRSLVAPSTFLWLVTGWFLPNNYVLPACLLVLFFLFLPALVHVGNSLLHCPKGRPLKSHFKNIAHELSVNFTQIALQIVFLPHQAAIHLDAIIRTIYRIKFSKKNLLEWTTAADTEAMILMKNCPSLSTTAPTEILVVLCTLVLLVFGHSASLMVAIPFLLLWASSPYIIHIISKIKKRKEYIFLSSEIAELRLISRKTWLFFETFVGDEDNWLAPDNFQEDPKAIVAHRTSPTNMGVLLLSTTAAYDFGYLGTLELLSRLEKTQGTMENLERRNGHFYNWYDTLTLKPLHPIYISTVDSGNLAAHLITMKSTCLNFLELPVMEPQLVVGLSDTLRLMKKELNTINARYLSTAILPKSQEKNELESLLQLLIENNTKANPTTFEEWAHYCKSTREAVAKFSDVLDAFTLIHSEKHFSSLLDWTSIALQTIEKNEVQINSFDPCDESLLESFINRLQFHLPELYLSLETPLFELKAVRNKKLAKAHHLPELYRQQALKLLLVKNKIADHCQSKQQKIPQEMIEMLEELEQNLSRLSLFSENYLLRLNDLANRYNDMAMSFDFTFLYNSNRKIFPIGYNVSEGKMDNSFYDLLASEARVASFFAIAKGDVPQIHWFHLGRQMSKGHGARALVSWSATMFEYLMPLLIMKNYADTLLYQTYEATVQRQIAYGKEIGLPWGISESGYNARDLHQAYQYGPFGIPGMGLKYGLSSDQVISPYSSALAALINPQSALLNFHRLKKEKAYGKYGFYESIDYTKERLQKGQKKHIIKSFMVHHQGMIIIALDNVLHNNIMQERFHADPIVRATELLLQEKIPEHSAIVTYREKKPMIQNIKEDTSGHIRHFNNPLSLYPKTQILSNGQYTVMLTAAGSGFSICNGLSINRWNEDVTLDANGSFVYLHDHFDNKTWSNTYAPLKEKHNRYQASFTEHKVEYWRRSEKLGCHTEIIVSPEDNVELKILTLSNTSTNSRHIDVTSYMEPVLALPADDRAHPTFSKLFIETEFIASKKALLFYRRKRSANDKEQWGIHVVSTNAQEYSGIEFETDRTRFIGRGRTPANPIAVMENVALSNADGTVLDPIISLRQFLQITPGETVKICFTSGVANSREEALRLIDQYHDIHSFQRENELSWTKTQAQLRHLNLTHSHAHLFQELAGTLIYSNPVMRPVSEILMKNIKSQEGLWAQGISGDNPILLLQVAGERDIPLVRLLLHAHEYLRLKRIILDLVIISNEMASYRMSFHDELIKQTHVSGTFEFLNKNGGIFLLSASAISEADKDLLTSYARVVIDGHKGSLKEQLQRLKSRNTSSSFFDDPKIKAERQNYTNSPLLLPKLNFFNGLGGFTPAGDQYVLYLNKDQSPPAPWINVIANSDNFGFLISETGSGYTWSANSRENRLTPWSNDPVSDQGGEAIYIRDEESHALWSPCPWPIRKEGPYLVRHGMGHSQFEYNAQGIRHQSVYFAALNDHVKIIRLKLKNEGASKRKISVTYFAEWILANNKSNSSHYIITGKTEHPNALSAWNPFSNDFNNRKAYMAVSGKVSSFTCDRREFLGRNGSFRQPLGMRVPHLKNKTGAGLDPCAAIRTVVELGPLEETEVIMLLGQTDKHEQIHSLVNFYLNEKNCSQAFNDVQEFWKKTTGTIQVKTPSPELDLMCNQWLLYQTLSCRIWARSALYQSGGAYGFRDQLQDIMSLVYAHPEIAREHIVKTAGHQFPMGDVQHWWHPPQNKGVRTRFSDDLLWLPYVVSHYIKRTGDLAILEEMIPFIEGPELVAEQEDLYIHPTPSNLKSSLYDHCLRAIDHSLKTGAHGLPLMGAGDWNDGMNKVGIKGTGESVWVAWFLAKILNDFSAFCPEHNDLERLNQYKDHARLLTESIEANAWDGNWYLRAFFDDGTPLGSSKSDECKIDSIAQSWSVLTALGAPERQSKAMNEVANQLVLKKEKLCLLFTPPFNYTLMNPGYIKGYPPGIRENGGQYTHAAIWAAMAFARLKNADKAYEILSNINPITRTTTYRGIQLYRVEPYVLSADIYFGKNYSGRGGWSWYTGSSSLYYQAALEYVLGMNKVGDEISFSPCIPANWKKYEIIYLYQSAKYLIEVLNPSGLSTGDTSIVLDGQEHHEGKIKLIDDGGVHHISVTLTQENS